MLNVHFSCHMFMDTSAKLCARLSGITVLTIQGPSSFVLVVLYWWSCILTRISCLDKNWVTSQSNERHLSVRRTTALTSEGVDGASEIVLLERRGIRA
jgi:hypothetical protein